MRSLPGDPVVFRFGPFDLDLRAGELSKSGIRTRLQDHPLAILTLLLDHPGEVVTREDLRRRLWPEGTHVDFEHGVNSAIKRLRDALGDNAERPRFVETLPRRGYRFIAPVVVVDLSHHHQDAPAPGPADGLPASDAAPVAAPPVAAPAAVPPPVPRADGQRRAGWRPWAWFAGGAGGALALALLVWVLLRPAGTPPVPLQRVDLDLGMGFSVHPRLSSAVLSPDGSRVVFTGRSPEGRRTHFLRLLTGGNAVELPGTGAALHPFFSPDSRRIAFFHGATLQVLDLDGQAPILLCSVPALALGGSWGDDGQIVIAFGTSNGLWRVRSSGGTLTPLTHLDKARGEVTHRWPQVLPGAAAVLFTAHTFAGRYDEACIEVMSLGSRERKTLVRGGSFGRYVASGHLVYVAHNVLFAAPMDLGRLELTGPAVPVLDAVVADADTGMLEFSASQNGSALCFAGTWRDRASVPVWRTPTGQREVLSVTPGSYSDPRVSPDNSRVALTVGQRLNARQIGVWEPGHQEPRRVVSDSIDLAPVWAPDGRHLVHTSDQDRGVHNLYWRRSDGVGQPVRLTTSNHLQAPFSFSPRGDRLAFFDVDPESDADIWIVPLDLRDPDHPVVGTPEPYLRTPAEEAAPMFSPDGRWMAYQANGTGRVEVYVRRYPDTGERWQISREGGTNPLWVRSRSELLYEATGRQVMVVPFEVKAGAFVPGEPRPWAAGWQLPRYDASYTLRNFDVSPDGHRILALEPPADAPDRPRTTATLLLNFFDELQRRAPARR